MYRIFGAESSIILRPDALELNFVNVNEKDRQYVIEITRRSSSMLKQDIGSYAQCYVSLSSGRHAEVAGDGNVDRYLNQFALKQNADLAKLDSDLEYRPAAKVILSHKGQGWSAHRSVEKPDSPPNGLFVNTFVFIPSFNLAEFDEQRKLIDLIFDLADKAVELSYVGNSDAGEAFSRVETRD